MTHEKSLNKKRILRAARSRSKMSSCASRPRLVVSKSLRHIEAQLIDDSQSRTLFGTSTKSAKAEALKDSPAKIALLASEIATFCKANSIESIIFDRSGNPYHGNVAALADNLRKQGLNF
jgi:large subunit ribosomal protein L18